MIKTTCVRQKCIQMCICTPCRI